MAGPRGQAIASQRHLKIVVATADVSARIDRVEWTPDSSIDEDLQEALETDLAVDTGGDGDWIKRVGWPNYNNNGDSAESGDIEEGESSSMELTVEGAGDISFYWKVWSSDGYDYLEWELDGELQAERITGEQDWVQVSRPLGAGTHSRDGRDPRIIPRSLIF